MTSKQLLKKIRAYVEEHGITGGNPEPDGVQAACPRGLVMILSGEDHNTRDLFGVPKFKASREVLAALDTVAKRRKRSSALDDVGAVGNGAYSEGYARRLVESGVEYATDDKHTKLALKWIDAAGALL
jgi:hypothetical protein